MTVQARDVIEIYGLNTVLWRKPCLPSNNPIVVDNGTDVGSMFYSSMCWAGYVARWTIKNGHLYLVHIVGRKKLLSDKPILADWFSGIIVIREHNQRTVHICKGKILE